MDAASRRVYFFGRIARVQYYALMGTHGDVLKGEFFDPSVEVENLKGNLPHWRQDGVWYFVTFRLSDALPDEKLRQWKREREAWLRAHPEPRTTSDSAEYARLFPKRFHEWLDRGYGSCILRNPKARAIVEESLLYFNDERYALDEFVVMPNHVHVLVRPYESFTLSAIESTWKSYTSHELNKLLRKAGPNWQKESFDHIVRSANAFAWFQQYIRDNPKPRRERNAST